MPARSKAAAPRQKDPEPDQAAPKTIAERTARVYAQGHPYLHPPSSSSSNSNSNSNSSNNNSNNNNNNNNHNSNHSNHRNNNNNTTTTDAVADRVLWAHAHVARTPELLKQLPNKAQKDVWKAVNDASVPLRALRKPTPAAAAAGITGRDRFGAAIGDYSPAQFARRCERGVQLAALEVQSWAFVGQRERERTRSCPAVGSAGAAGEEEEGLDALAAEKLRRREMAALRMELYGERVGAYAADPVWDDVVPMPVEEGEGALAAIAYPEDYAEAISYLRAVMAKKEYSPRCLQLTQHIIAMNPAHYTVWLYRFAIVQALDLPLADELTWLNGVSLDNLKNYQIWHHRRLLMDRHLPALRAADDANEAVPALVALAAMERAFLAQILAEDTKNYHVWSYRQYLVPQLGGALGFCAEELAAADELIDEDVRNNSAWAHRFFVVFSDPAHATPGLLASAHDPRVPAAILDREVAYAQEKALLAPQNQSPWNYLRGVLSKGGRGVASVEAFVGRFVSGLGEEGERVTSTHALAMLADICAAKGERERADLALRRLGERWDRVRLGYWEWRRQVLEEEEMVN